MEGEENAKEGKNVKLKEEKRSGESEVANDENELVRPPAANPNIHVNVEKNIQNLENIQNGNDPQLPSPALFTPFQLSMKSVSSLSASEQTQSQTTKQTPKSRKKKPPYFSLESIFLPKIPLFPRSTRPILAIVKSCKENLKRKMTVTVTKSETKKLNQKKFSKGRNKGDSKPLTVEPPPNYIVQEHRLARSAFWQEILDKLGDRFFCHIVEDLRCFEEQERVISGGGDQHRDSRDGDTDIPFNAYIKNFEIRKYVQITGRPLRDDLSFCGPSDARGRREKKEREKKEREKKEREMGKGRGKGREKGREGSGKIGGINSGNLNSSSFSFGSFDAWNFDKEKLDKFGNKIGKMQKDMIGKSLSLSNSMTSNPMGSSGSYGSGFPNQLSLCDVGDVGGGSRFTFRRTSPTVESLTLSPSQQNQHPDPSQPLYKCDFSSAFTKSKSQTLTASQPLSQSLSHAASKTSIRYFALIFIFSSFMLVIQALILKLVLKS